MHDGSAPGWRQIIDRHHASLVDDLTGILDAERELSYESRRRLTESLNQTLRRIRQTSAEHETLQLLLEASDTFAARAVVLLIENHQARIAAWRGVVLRTGEDDGAPIDLSDAAAIASCAESRDPVVALATPGELSPVLASALRGADGEKVYLFPVTARLNTVAMMMASGEVSPASIELLCEAAGMRLELFAAEVQIAPATPLVQIAPAPDAPTTWSRLTKEEQALHLRAQRTARVRVAQIRIGESEALRNGSQAGDIYGALRKSIDAARDEYRRAYMSQSTTMVDYLHLEFLRSLAHEDSRLLGRDYPGPIV